MLEQLNLPDTKPADRMVVATSGTLSFSFTTNAQGQYLLYREDTREAFFEPRTLVNTADTLDFIIGSLVAWGYPLYEFTWYLVDLTGSHPDTELEPPEDVLRNHTWTDWVGWLLTG